MREKLERALDRWTPPGGSRAMWWLRWMCGLELVIGVAYCLAEFLSRYLDQRYWLTWGYGSKTPGAVMTDFGVLMEGTMRWFLVAAVLLVVLMGLHYGHHRFRSKSVYLMRRLPDRWEYHRRCLALPLAGLALCGVLAFACLCLCYAIYMLATPAVWLTPDQWQKIWR